MDDKLELALKWLSSFKASTGIIGSHVHAISNELKRLQNEKEEWKKKYWDEITREKQLPKTDSVPPTYKYELDD